eukprot:m.469577 g.469577  ORF g.469577 m.469577 type:complete len:790 (-) comp57088_c0_seq5:117-2486(-)
MLSQLFFRSMWSRSCLSVAQALLCLFIGFLIGSYSQPKELPHETTDSLSVPSTRDHASTSPARHRSFARPENIPNITAYSIESIEAFRAQFPPISGRPTRICLVTSAISGPTLNGGIATAFYALAMRLGEFNSQAGYKSFDITILYAAHPYYYRGSEQEWAAKFAENDIRFIGLPESIFKFYGHKYVVRAYRIFEWLRDRENDFDVISYHDYMANGYYLALAKHQKINFSNVFLFVQCHSTTRWADNLNSRPPKDHNTLGYYYMEQKSVELADARVSPSAYYYSWMQQDGLYDLSKGRSFVVQNLIYPARNDEQVISSLRSRHFAFFGRLEVRKGLMTFCDSLDILVSRQQIQPERVTFIGPNVPIDNMPASEYIRSRAREGQWAFELALEHTFNTEQALAFIQAGETIVVLPTLGDNSPYALLEMIAHNIPVITTDAGGGKELFVDDSDSVIAPMGNPSRLADRMIKAMNFGIRNVRLSSPFSVTTSAYIGLLKSFHAGSAGHRSTDPFLSYQPHQRILMGITTHNRPKQLFDCVQSIAKQDYPAELLNVVVIDDSSTDVQVEDSLRKCDATLSQKGIAHQFIRKETPEFVARIRNEIIELAVAQAAHFVCFMDDDDLALPEMLRRYMFVSETTGADLLTDISDNYDLQDGMLRHSHRSLSIGNSFAHNFFINNFGKANFCVKPRAALSFGGHHVSAIGTSPYVDWGFFTRASLAGLRIELVPLVLYKYAKYSKGSIFYGMTSLADKYNGHLKMINDTWALVPPEFRDILLYCRYKLGVPQIVGDGPM